MATNFPSSLDTYTDVSTGAVIAASTTNDMQDAIEALEVKLGANSSGVTSSLDYIVKSASSTDPGHLHTTAGISGQIAVAQGGTGASTASAARTALGVAIGSDVQAYDADLTELAGLSDADGNFIVGSASGWVAESGATARTSIGLGSVENTALSTWAGSANITTLGTITSGTIGSGAVIGGATLTLGSDATGDIYYRSAGGILTRLGIGATDEVLTVAGGLPSWAAAGGNFLTNNAADTLTVNDSADALYIVQQGTGETLALESQTTGKGLRIKSNDTGATLLEDQDVFAIESTESVAVSDMVVLGYESSGPTNGYMHGYIKLVSQYSNSGTPSVVNNMVIAAGNYGSNSGPSRFYFSHAIGVPSGGDMFINQTSGVDVIKHASSGPYARNTHYFVGGASSFDAVVGDGQTKNVGLWIGTSGVARIGDIDTAGNYIEFAENGDMTMAGAMLQKDLETPASATATGTTGQIVWDGSYVYICTATDTWKRVAVATW